MSMANPCSSRASRAFGAKNLTLAAASSMARGKPSSRAQMPATAGALALVTWKSGLTAWARSIKSATASYCESVTRSGRCLGSGSDNGGTANSRSACTCSMTRLVTSTLSFGQAVSRSATMRAASTICSKLSNISSDCFSCRKAFRRSSRGRSPSSSTPKALARAGTTDATLLTRYKATKNTPSGKESLRLAATCKARRVLPTPTVPVRVSKRTSARCESSRTTAISRSRPMKDVGWTGKL